MNIDLKGFRESYYKELGGDWETVDGIERHRTIHIRHKYREMEEDGSLMENQQDIGNVEEENQQAYSKEGYVVRVHFSEDDYSATDALKYYLKQMTELKF